MRVAPAGDVADATVLTPSPGPPPDLHFTSAEEDTKSCYCSQNFVFEPFHYFKSKKVFSFGTSATSPLFGIGMPRGVRGRGGNKSTVTIRFCKA